MKGNVDLTVDQKFRENPDKKHARREWNSKSREPKYSSESTTATGINSMWTTQGLSQTFTTFSGNTTLNSDSGTVGTASPAVRVNGETVSLYDVVRGDRKEPFPWAPKTFYPWMLSNFIKSFEPIFLGNKEDREYKKRQSQFNKGDICENCGNQIPPWGHKALCRKCEEKFKSNSFSAFNTQVRFMSFKERPQKYFSRFDDKPVLQFTSGLRRRRNMMNMEIV